MNPTHTLRAVRGEFPDTEVILMTAYATVENAVESGEQYEAPAPQATAAQGTALTHVIALRAGLDPSDRKDADDWIAGHVTMFAGRPHVPRSRTKVTPSSMEVTPAAMA